MTGITEIDVMINNEKRQVCAIRNLRRVIQFQRIVNKNDVMLNNEK